MRFVLGNFFDGDGADASRLIDVDELFCCGIFAGDENVAEEDGERLVPDEVARDKNGVAEAERLLLARVADLNHVADTADHFRLVFLAALFEEALEHRSVVEMIFDGVLSFAGDDDDVLDAGGDALFSDVLDLRLVHDGEHFFGLRLGSGKKTRTEARGGEDSLANFFYSRGVRSGASWIGRHRGCEPCKLRPLSVALAQ